MKYEFEHKFSVDIPFHMHPKCIYNISIRMDVRGAFIGVIYAANEILRLKYHDLIDFIELYKCDIVKTIRQW